MSKSNEIGYSLFGYDDGFKVHRTEGCIENNTEINLENIISLNLDKIQIRQTTHLFGCIKVFAKDNLYIFWIQYNTTDDYGRDAYQAATFVTKNHKMNGKEIFNNLSKLCSKNNQEANIIDTVSTKSLEPINISSLTSYPNKVALDRLTQNHNADDFFETVLSQPYNTVYACFEEITITDDIFKLNNYKSNVEMINKLSDNMPSGKNNLNDISFTENISRPKKKSDLNSQVKKTESSDSIISSIQAFYKRIYNSSPVLPVFEAQISRDDSRKFSQNDKTALLKFLRIIEEQNKLKKLIEEVEDLNKLFYKKFQDIKLVGSKIENLLEETKEDIKGLVHEENYQEIKSVDLNNRSILISSSSDESVLNNPVTKITIITSVILFLIFIIVYIFRNYSLY